MSEKITISLEEFIARLRPSTFSMIKHFVENGFDPHRQTAEFREVMIDEIIFAFTGDCNHKPSNVVAIASGDSAAYIANGVFCRACRQRIKAKVISWELDGLPSSPRSA